MDIVIDIDGTICTEEKTYSRFKARPLEGASRTIEALRLAGHRIILFTARSWAEYELTEKWLADHDIHYHQLICGKPPADIYIDDRAIGFTSWKDALDKIMEKGHK